MKRSYVENFIFGSDYPNDFVKPVTYFGFFALIIDIL